MGIWYIDYTFDEQQKKKFYLIKGHRCTVTSTSLKFH